MKIRELKLAVACVAALAAPSVLAQDADDLAEMQFISKAAGLITPEEATTKALAAKAGTIIDADVDRKFGKYYYEFEIIDAQGVEWEVELDGKTGEVRKIKKDWF
jgi:uncharacterized membrane protein YkoI